jgi:outer membrane protein assembly factor BamE (lipoprotein component of BamABCDE complex)
MKNIFILLLAIVSMAGCATSGRAIDQNRVEQIKEGVTTEQEVIQLLGTPYMKTLDSNGKVIMLYQYTKVKNRASNFIPVVGLFNTKMDMQQKMLTVLVGKDGKVEKYTFNDSNSEIKAGLLNTN